MYNPRFDKKTFKKEVKNNVKSLYQKNGRRGDTAAVIPGGILCGEGSDH